MKLLKAFLIFTLIFALCCANTYVFASNIPAEECGTHTSTTSYNWYCKKSENNAQPPLDGLFSFIEKEELATFYIDKHNTDFSSEDKVIYLTFDAGYENGNVEKILDIMKDEQVTGAFFILENLVNRNSDLVKRMINEGHLVCNHTATHPDMSVKNTTDEFMKEILAMEDICEKAKIQLSHYYRPPEGRFSEENLKIAAENGYKTVFWSFAYADWDNNAQSSPEKAIEKVISGTHNGEVILLHPTSATNAEILDDLIKEWKSMGFRFGTLDELTK